MSFDLSKLAQQQLNQMQGRSNYQDRFVQMPEGKTGVLIVRILPASEEGELPWVITRIHRNINDRTYHCPRTQSPDGYWRGDCPLCDLYQSFWRAADNAKSEKEAAQWQDMGRSIKPRPRFYYNVIIRQLMKDGKVLTNIGPKILSNGEKLHTKVLYAICGNKKLYKKPLGDITDFSAGYDLKIVKTTSGGFANYDESEFEGPLPTGSEAEVKEWMSTLWDLTELRKIESIEELQKQSEIMQGLREDDSEKFSSNTQQFTPTPAAPSKPVMSSKPTAPVRANTHEPISMVSEVISKVNDDIDDPSMDDIDMSIVGKDFMDDIDKILQDK